MPLQTTIARSFTVSGIGLHTGRKSAVVVHPAAIDFGRRVVSAGDRAADPVPIIWSRWVSSKMSTSVALGEGRSVRTIEHLMASLAAFDIDNVLLEVRGAEIPILDGSARHWCRCLDDVGLVTLPAPRRTISIRKPVQVSNDGGFLRAEPAADFEVDVTHDVLPAFPVMRWAGVPDALRFKEDIARARSFGNLHRLLGRPPVAPSRPLGDMALMPNTPDPVLAASEPHESWADLAAQTLARDPRAPLLRGARPWRAALIIGGTVLGGARYPDEPVRHVTLDMIGDLTLAGAPLIGRIVAHNPSHEKTYVFVKTLMSDPEAWEMTDV